MGDILEGEDIFKFDVEWTNRYDTFASVIEQMYANKEQFDLTIKIDGDERLAAHRHVLAILSPEIEGMLEKELNPNGSFVTETSEVELLNIPYNIMEKILEFVYYGSAHVCKWEMKKFCNALSRLGIVNFYDHEIKDFKKKLKTNNETAEVVYRDRGRLIAEGFKQMFCADRWFDITIEAEGIPFGAHRLALSVGSVYFREMFDSVPASTVATTVEPQVNLSFEKTFNMVAFIYSGMLKHNDMVDYLNAGESLEILGMRGCDAHYAEKPKRGKPSNQHKIFATAKDIPVADKPLRDTDIVTEKINQSSGKNAARMSSLSTSGSEYDVEKDSDNYSDSDDAMPLVAEAKHPKLQRAAKVPKKVQPKKCSNGRKKNQANATAPKQATASGSRSRTRAEKSVPKIVSNESQGDLTYTISKNDYELFMRLLQRNGDSEEVLPEPEQQIDGDVAENDEILDQAVGEYQQQYADDSEYQDFDNSDQYPCEYDDDETMEGAVGSSLQKFDKNDNVLDAVDESNEWEGENGYGDDHLVEEDEDCSTNNDFEQQTLAKGKGLTVRTWTDEDYVDEAEFDTSPRGATWLLHDGYCYTLNPNTQANDYKRWRCANHGKYKCKAKTKTKEIDGVEMAQQPDPKHSHPRVY